MPKNIHHLTILSDSTKPSTDTQVSTSEQKSPSTVNPINSVPLLNTKSDTSSDSDKIELKSKAPIQGNLNKNKWTFNEHFNNLNKKETKSNNISTKPRPPPLPIQPIKETVQTPSKPHDPLINTSKPSIQHLSELVQKLDITETQKDKLEEFLKCREKIGDLTTDDLSVAGELGSGNGGVVLKVRHRKTGTVMAKKVI